MKKMIVLAVVLLALFGVTFAVAQSHASDAQSEEMEEVFVHDAAESELQEDVEIYEMTGEIIEVNEEEGFILMDNAQLGHVQVLIGDDTVVDGVEQLEVGQFASVMHDGQMTRSLPLQITAMRIGVYPVEGVVVEVTDTHIVIERADTGEEVIITLPVIDAASGATEDTAEIENETEAETEAEIEAEAETELEAEIEAELEIEVEEDAAVTDEEAAETEEIIEEAVILVGDHVIAYTTGVSTMSLPPQMNAIAIVHAPEATPAEAETVG